MGGLAATPPPAGPSDGDAGGGKCSPSLVYVPEEGHGDGDGHPLAESELESIGNSILNARPFACIPNRPIVRSSESQPHKIP